MGYSARKVGSIWPILTVGLVSVGCVAGTAGFDVGPSHGPALKNAVALPVGLEPPQLAAAREGLSGPKKGPGLGVAMQWTVFSDWRTKATDAVPTIGGPASGQYMYRDLFDDGYGISVSLVIRRPAAGRLSIGDTYVLGRFDLQRFAGKVWEGTAGQTVFDGFEQYRIWLEAKTMFRPVGRALRPYARYGGGLVQMSEVGTEWSLFWDPTVTAGVSGGFGIDFRLGLWFFADVGIDVIGSPMTAGEGGVGRAEPMIATPLRVGLLLNF